MNERIWKLAEQIVCFEQDMDGSMEPNENGQWIRVDEMAKFAELIVRECMDVVAKKCASPTAYNALVEHFGVEE